MLQYKNRYGYHQKIHIQPFTVDRTNLFQGRVEFHVEEDFDKPDATLLSLSFGRTIAQLSGIQGLASGTASHPTPLCVGVERRYDDAGSLAIYTYSFEGMIRVRDERYIEFELEFSMNQEPIETHPNFPSLDSSFGPWDPLNRQWPRNVSQTAAAIGLTGATNAPGGPTTNPLYGVTSYLAPQAVYRLTFTDADVDSDFMANIGAIVVPPKIGNAFPDFQAWVENQTRRNWLKLAPKVRQRGSCMQVTEEYMLSGPRGWDPNIYSVDALHGQAL